MGFGAQTFEIRKGRASDSSEPVVDDAPLGPIALPQSITGAEADEHLKKRFGVDSLPELDKHHTKVTLTTSMGVGGPVRSAKSMVLIALFLLLVGGGILLFFAKQNGTLDKLLQGQ